MTAFLLQTVLISLSGVMAPGPLSAAVVAQGRRSPHAGAVAAVGHGVVEFPLMALLLAGLVTWEPAAGLNLHAMIGIAGGGVMFVMGLTMVRSGWARVSAVSNDTAASVSGSALGVGVLLTGTNPYFLVWWLTVGAALLLRASGFGWPMVAAFAMAHWLCDLVWLWILSALVHRGGRILGAGFNRAVVILCGLFLLAMGVDFVMDGLSIAMAADTAATQG